MKKTINIILVFSGLFWLIGSLAMIGQDIFGVIFFAVLSFLSFFFSRNYIVKLFDNFIAKRKLNKEKRRDNKKEQEELLRAKIDKEQEDRSNKLKIKQELVTSGFQNKKDLDGKYSFYINEEKKQWYIDDVCSKIYNFNDILSFELISDDKTVTNTISQKKVAPVKALVGKKLMGSAGAIVGGTAGKTVTYTHQNDYCKELAIVISINSFETPQIKIPFISQQMVIGSQVYKSVKSIADEYIALLQIIDKNK